MQHIRTELVNAAILTVGTSGQADEKIIPISTIQSFLNVRSGGSLIPTDGPIPDHLLPLSISRELDPLAVRAAFGWREFTVGEWVQHITSPQVTSGNVEFDITRSPQWAERVLHVLTRAWPSCAQPTKDIIVALLKDKACIPTSAGLKTPSEAYFQNVHVFPDLPIVTLPSGTSVKGPLEKVLQGLGVRKHVELQIVFDRCVSPGFCFERR